MGQDANVINTSKVARSHGKKMKASVWFNISDIRSCILDTTNSSLIGTSDMHPKGFKTCGMIPSTWFPLIKTASETSFDNPQSPPPYIRCSFLLVMAQPRSTVA